MGIDCIFCNIDREKIVSESQHLLAFFDSYPVTKGHLLVKPKAHRKDYFALTHQEAVEVQSLLLELQNKLRQDDSTIDGFNIGMNCGASAGQTVFHCHIHLIPRRTGDMKDPKGGVRGVIPEKQKY